MPTAFKPLRVSIAAIVIALCLLGIGIWAVGAQAQTNPQVEQGAALYSEYCAVCHGPDGSGRVGATLAKDWPSVRPDLAIKTTIENGIPGSRMPAWSNAKGGPLSAAEIEALVAYILSWQTGGAGSILVYSTPTALPPVTPVPDIVGDPVKGALVFQQNCIMCHGEGGKGKIGKTLAQDWPSIRPDLLIANTVANGVPNTVMPAWSLAKGGPLSEQDIDNVVAYILALPKVTQVQVTAESTGSASSLSWLSGWGGLLVFLVLLAVIIGLAYYFQRRK